MRAATPIEAGAQPFSFQRGWAGADQRRPEGWPAPQQSRGGDVARLGGPKVHGARAAATIVLEIVGYALLALERPHAGSFDRTDVYESIGAPILRLDEAKTLVGIEEFYSSSDHSMFPSVAGRQSALRC